jgi:hypothetical protein
VSENWLAFVLLAGELPLFGGPRLLAVDISGLIPAAMNARSRHIESQFRSSSLVKNSLDGNGGS